MHWSIQDTRNYLLLNSLTTMSDQDRTSPHGINIIPSGQWVGMKKNINKGLIMWPSM